MTDTDSAEHCALEEQFNLYMSVLEESLDEYESKNPSWFAQTVVRFVLAGLRSLKFYLEDQEETEISWKQPIVELHYPIDWNWDDWGKGERDGVLQYSGLITIEDLKDRAKGAKKLGEIFVEHRNLVVLNSITNEVAFEKRGEEYSAIVSSDVAELLELYSEKGERVVFEELYKPFQFGAAGVELDEADLVEGDPLPETTATKLAVALEELDLPPLTFDGSIDGYHFKVAIFAHFHQMVVDVDAREAHFPIVVGLEFLPSNIADVTSYDPANTSQSIGNPDKWTEEVRTKFWEEIFGALERLADRLEGEHPEEQDQTNAVNDLALSDLRRSSSTIDILFSARVTPFDATRKNRITESLIQAVTDHGAIQTVDVRFLPLEEPRHETDEHSTACFPPNLQTQEALANESDEPTTPRSARQWIWPIVAMCAIALCGVVVVNYVQSTVAFIMVGILMFVVYAFLKGKLSERGAMYLLGRVIDKIPSFGKKKESDSHGK